MVTHRLFHSSYVFYCFFYRPTQRVGLSLFFLFFYLLANSTCWPFSVQPDGSHRLLLFAFPHAREILLEVLTIDSNRKLDAVQFLEHVCIPRKDLINLVRTMPSWRPFTKLLSLVPNGNTASQIKSPTWKSLGLTFLLYARATLALFSLIFSSDQSLSSVRSSTLSFIKAAYCSADRSF